MLDIEKFVDEWVDKHIGAAIGLDNIKQIVSAAIEQDREEQKERLESLSASYRRLLNRVQYGGIR